jgi:transcription initiation factor TFIID subunit TAF12
MKSKLNKLIDLNEINYQYQQLQYKNIELLCNIDMWKQRLKLLYDIYITIKPIDDIEETGRYNKDIFILDGCFELYNDINQTSSSSLLQQQTQQQQQQQQQQLQHQQQQQQQHRLQLFNNCSLIVNTNSTTAITTTTTADNADNADVQHNNDNYHNHDNHHVGQEIFTNSLLNESNIEQINFTNSNKINKNQDITMIGKSRVFMSIKPSDLEVFMAKDKAGFDLFIAVLGKTFNLFHVIFSLFSKYEIIIMVILVRLSTDF